MLVIIVLLLYRASSLSQGDCWNRLNGDPEYFGTHLYELFYYQANPCLNQGIAPPLDCTYLHMGEKAITNLPTNTFNGLNNLIRMYEIDV